MLMLMCSPRPLCLAQEAISRITFNSSELINDENTVKQNSDANVNLKKCQAQ